MLSNEEEINKKFDCEPTWESIINLYCDMDKKVIDVKKDLLQMAKLCDSIRQLQKKNKIIVIYPNGEMSYKECKKK